MKTKSIKTGLMVSTTICGVLSGIAGLAVAQAASADEKADATTEVVITGSRIKAPNRKSISPITSVGQEDIKAQGVTRIEDLVNSLPQAFAAQGANISNGSNGTATVDLRGLGANRTLVLINGRRLGPGTPGSTAADLDFIPSSLVKRVDVVTGGASAVYGSDAIAGVVNFIMDDNFDGLKVEYNYGAYNHHNNSADAQAANQARGFALPKSDVWDGRSKEYTLAFGAGSADGKGHLSAYATYLSIDKVLEADRDYSACTLNSGDSFSCGGSGTAYPARVGSYQVSGTGASATLVPRAPAYVYNYGPTNYFQRPDERYSLGAFAHYNLNEHLTAYTEAMFMHDYSVAQIAPGGIFASSQTLNCDNAFATAQQLSVMCGAAAGTSATVVKTVARRNVEGGGRQSTFENTDYRIVGGIKGNIVKGWDYDASFTFYSASSYSEQRNYFITTRIKNALIAKKVGNQIVCQSVIDGTDPACVPYNLFDANGVTKAMLDYLQAPGSSKGNLSQKFYTISFTGDLGQYGIKSPWANDGVGVAFGYEHRNDNSHFAADYLSQQGLLSGAGGASPTVDGATNVSEGFIEARVPLVSDAPFAKSLNFETGYRSSKYNQSGTVGNYKYGIDWLPISQLRLRASFQHATRAPNINELFSPQNVVLDGTGDPCAGTTPAATAAQCALMGVTAAQYGNIEKNPANQYNGLSGGNPNLKPETADTISYGFVASPSFIKGLVASVDYFDIHVKNTIGSVGADNILANCVATGSSQWCSLVHRGPAGTLWLDDTGYVIDTNYNAGETKRRGYDVNIDYSHSLGSAGSLAATLAGTKQDINGLAGVGNNCVGLYGPSCGVSPKWRHKARVTWYTPYYGIKLSAQWRHIDKVSADGSVIANNDGVVPAATDVALKAVDYLDLGFSMPLYKNYTIRVGANNITDVTPPYVGGNACPAGACNGNVYAQTYDALGRYVYMNISAKF